MLFPRREDLPAHVAPSLAFDYDVFNVDAPDGDFSGAMHRLRASGAPDLFWTRYNRGHWVVTDADYIETILTNPDRFSSRAMRVPKSPIQSRRSCRLCWIHQRIINIACCSWARCRRQSSSA